MGFKGRKIGRMKKKPAYKKYLAEGRRAKNGAQKLFNYMKKFQNWKPIITSNIQPHLNKLLKS